jgi:prepilin-type N-terminal cleavage/methylation domain-containing protein
MINRQSQSGFTAVELLITLFVAVAFLVAGYQLYNVILKVGGNVRGQATASNVAYDYMRRYSPSATNPCTVLTPLSNSPISVSGIGNVNVTVAFTCPYAAVMNVTKITVTVNYNSPTQTVVYGTYVEQ